MDDPASGLYRPSLPAIPAAEEDPRSNHRVRGYELQDSQLIGAVAAQDGGAIAGAKEAPSDTMGRTDVKILDTSIVKRKRGRPPKGQAKAPAKKRKEEEDVCFICFDGGNLVLCDRRDCPKAYHTTCIRRDESFFRQKGRWNCGWHICSNCEKSSHYMCYTCTYSLCKGCVERADMLCVRESKGFCRICLRTIMLIENCELTNEETAKVDFDDKTSWEYLFKVYWIYLKGKLSLTLDEICHAEKKPCKGFGVMAHKCEPPSEPYNANGDKCSTSNSPPEHQQSNAMNRKRTRKPTNFLNKDSLNAEKLGVCAGSEWASKELLEFVAHMKNGDTSVLSHFDVQSLLLDYIKRNNLRDPRQKCQIICDSRLEKLFRKDRVGHIEMLKLLEYHFLLKEESRADNINPGLMVDTVEALLDYDMNKKKGCKTHKKGEETVTRTNNLDDYAAIDVHNINLIYLRRDLMEKLIEEDTEKFDEKVVGSIVRIRISSGDQKQDIHRLVQVVGTGKVAKPYKIGKTTVDVMLEILNLDKKEAVSIDAISNQDFSEDECRRLRQSIRCGLVKHLTVGEIQKKLMALQSVRVNDWLEMEILRLSHLRDRASEKGRRKELRECVEKLQLLNSTEERQRRLEELPEVHADPKMDPSYKSDEDVRESENQKQENIVRPNYPGFTKRVRGAVSPLRMSTRLQKLNESSQKIVSCGLYHKAKLRNPVSSSVVEIGGLNNQDVGTELSSSVCETGWHYQDPSGKIQGPFSMLQLRKWDANGHFPPDLRVWKINEKQDESVLLSDALKGELRKETHMQDNDSPQPRDSNSEHKGPSPLPSSPVTKQSEILEQNCEIDFPDLPSPSPKPNVESKHALSPEIPIEDSGISWSSPIATPDTEAGSAHPLLTQPVSATSIWQVIVTGLDESGSLPEESVSDLLNKVDAIESLCALASPTSINCERDLMRGLEDLSPTLDPEKSDVLSSTGDLQVTPSQLEMKIESHGVAHADVVDPLKRPNGISCTSAEVEGETKKPVDVPIKQWETGETHTNIGWSNSVENISIWGSQTKNNNRAFEDPGFRRDRAVWNRQLPFGTAPEGVGYHRPPPKGKRVCKFYESGCCKKGAFCDYLHP